MNKKVSVTPLVWHEARELVEQVNPELAHVIDRLSPSEDYKLYKLKYVYGSIIFEQGKLRLPVGESLETVSLYEEGVPKEYQEQLDYNAGACPVTLVLNKTIELYLEHQERLVSFGHFGQGSLVALWRLLDGETSFHPSTLWNVSAGVRTLFMLPKISEKGAFNRLRKEFHLSPYSPKGVNDHWYIFREIANHQVFGEPWVVEILVFGKNWFDKLADPAWHELHLYLLKQAWQASKYWRNKFAWDYTYTDIQQRRGLKPNPYVGDTVKHLISIALGAIPGHAPAIDNDCAPIKRIQYAYVSIYGLKKYYPTIMVPMFLSEKNAYRPVYYSLQVPTAIELSLKSSEHSSTINDLYETNSLLQKYFDEWFTADSKASDPSIREILYRAKFDFFHNDVAEYTQILPVTQLPIDDETFCQPLVDCHYHRFCANSSFVKGCVRIGRVLR